MTGCQTADYVKFLNLDDYLTVNSSLILNEFEETNKYWVEVISKKEQKIALKRQKHKLVIYNLENEGRNEAYSVSCE